MHPEPTVAMHTATVIYIERAMVAGRPKQKMHSKEGSIQTKTKSADRARRGAANEPKRRAANEVVAKDPSIQPGKLKRIGGSMSDD